MRIDRFRVLGLALAAALGCGSSGSGPGGLGGSGGSSSNGDGGGANGSGKGGSGGASMGGKGGVAGGAGSGTGGHLAGTGGTAGATGTGGSAGATATGGAPGSGGNGGAGACVQNIACKLSPPPSTGDIYQDCVNRINQFLTQCACLPALARATDGEACADQMAAYDAAMNSAHAGAMANICTPSGSQNECPGYASDAQVISLCMQQMWSEGPPPTSSCTGTCYQQHGHYINMTDPSVHRVACGFFTTSSGDVWAAQNFLR